MWAPMAIDISSLCCSQWLSITVFRARPHVTENTKPLATARVVTIIVLSKERNGGDGGIPHSHRQGRTGANSTEGNGHRLSVLLAPDSHFSVLLAVTVAVTAPSLLLVGHGIESVRVPLWHRRPTDNRPGTTAIGGTEIGVVFV